jgi:hypothetical protein
MSRLCRCRKVYPFPLPAEWTYRVYLFPYPAIWICRVYPLQLPAVWTCRFYPFHQQQYRSAVCIPFHRQQCECAGCTPFYPPAVWYRNEQKWSCGYHSRTRMLWCQTVIPDAGMPMHQPQCRCPAMINGPGLPIFQLFATIFILLERGFLINSKNGSDNKNQSFFALL